MWFLLGSGMDSKSKRYTTKMQCSVLEGSGGRRIQAKQMLSLLILKGIRPIRTLDYLSGEHPVQTGLQPSMGRVTQLLLLLPFLFLHVSSLLALSCSSLLPRTVPLQLSSVLYLFLCLVQPSLLCALKTEPGHAHCLL